MSFHEKSAWASLISMLVVYLVYFSIAFSGVGVFFVIFALIAAVIIQVSLFAGAQILIAIFTREIKEKGDVPPRDERDRGIELRSTRVSSYVLGTAVALWCIAAFILIAMSGGSVTARAAMTACQILFAGFVLASVAYYAMQVAGYRRTS